MTIKIIIYLINLLLVIWFIFYQNKNYRSSIKWLLFFLLIPLFSFVVYYFVGMGIKVNKRIYLNVEKRVNNLIQINKQHMKCTNIDLEKIIKVNKELNGSEITYHNDIKYYLDGNSYFSDLLFYLNEAKRSIHIEMYIFRDDEFGRTIMDLLIKKAHQGVKVKIIFDPNGNFKNQRNFFKKYLHKNMEIIKHSPFYYQIRNFNYRNHRKIIIIDGKIAFLGGFNFGLEYLSNDAKVDPFRDTQIKIIGESVLDLQKRFLIDFYYAKSLFSLVVNIDIDKEDIKVNKVDKLLPMQIVSTSYFIRENIKRSKLALLSMAKKEVYIQTPYFIIDPIMMEQLKLLLIAKVKVNIMVPLKYDQKIPFCATLSYVRELYNLGAKVYLYEGFIHSKTIIVDDYFLMVGSSNFDIRSFSLNLETDAYIYSYNEVSRYKKIFNIDIIHSLEYTYLIEEKLFSSFKIGKRIFRLISSLM